MKYRKKYLNSKIIDEISEKTGIQKKVVVIVIDEYFRSIRYFLSKNMNLNVIGFFKLKLRKSYQNLVYKYGNRVNFNDKVSYRNKKRKRKGGN